MMIDSAKLFSELIRFETELWNVVAERLRSEHGLALTWFEPMQVIACKRNCRVHDVVEALAITVGGASKLVDRIEAAGLCRRRVNPEDRRSSFIDLTDKGERLLEAASRTFAKEVESRLRSPLTSQRYQEFALTLLELRNRLKAGNFQE